MQLPSMRYDPRLVQPMREALTRLGFLELMTPDEVEATDRARSYFAPYPPSSPQIALFKDGRLVFMLERKDIEGRPPEEIARDLVGTFDAHCA